MKSRRMAATPARIFHPGQRALEITQTQKDVKNAGCSGDMYEKKEQWKQETIDPAISMKTKQLVLFQDMSMIRKELVEFFRASNPKQLAPNTKSEGFCGQIDRRAGSRANILGKLEWCR